MPSWSSMLVASVQRTARAPSLRTLVSISHRGRLLGDVRRCHERAPICDVHRVGNQQPRAPVDARSRIPAAVGLEGVIHLDGDHVIAAEDEVRRQVVGKRNVAVGTLAEILAVDPHLAVLVDAAELDGDHPAAVRFGQREALAVPADAGRQARLGRFFLAERPFDAPIVREVHASPGRVREIRLLRAGGVALEEFPAEVEALPDSRRGVLVGRLRLDGCGQHRRTGCLPQQTAPAQFVFVVHSVPPSCYPVGHALACPLLVLKRMFRTNSHAKNDCHFR